ncbi:copper resistance protein NlpE N-terminal domain-containing protein [Spirosoma sp. BT702]|uniref:Copper resistance protein NlpE N-terminal domain-containing protein n=1 Tax=Spirosoma profusum TaxID=2771354 RepID=A0A926XVL7_9BACT|nr:copper resistance protein NlpE N-terminal domain-containing protein [Spirosoma profusum]MBD2701169.1 copper resistance protein NlpE N-terminal domain-containing protein [Spirosoma profusum]
MKTLKISTFILLAACFVQASRTSPDPTTFVASTPCDMIPRTMLSIPANADCEFIKWNLALRRDPRNQNPTFYKLSYTYGMTQPGTTGFRNGGTSLTKEGNWISRKDATNKETYQLNSNTPETSLSFARLDDNLLHLLDPQGRLMVGHAGWSYTLNRK